MIKESHRVLWVACFVFALFSILIVQFFRVQIIQQEKWQRHANSQHELIVKEPFKRGLFYSNTSLLTTTRHLKQPFVMDIPQVHLFADPYQIPESKHQEVAELILNSINQKDSKDSILKELSHVKSRSRKLKMWLSLAEQKKLQAAWLSYAKKNKLVSNALFFVSDYKRSYPFKSLLGQVLHTIQENKEEVTRQGIPTGGLEYYFNSYLKGAEGKKKLLRSPKHPLDQGQTIQDPVHGADVYLTINHHLQAIAEEEIKKGVENCKAESGWAVMMDPYTGEVLACAQYPFFSPEDYKDYYANDEGVDQTRLKCICDSNEPGSVFKAITMSICLLANEELKKQGRPPVFDPNEKVSSLSGNFPGRSRPLQDPRPYRYTNMYLAMQKSTNIYLARIVERVIKELGVDWYRKQLCETFKLGQKTGIEYPLESFGFVPRPGHTNPNGSLEWSVPTPYSLAIGYNLTVNSLQMLSAYSAFANGGYLVKPTFVQKISKTDEAGREQILLDNRSLQRLENFPQILTPKISEEIMNCLKYIARPSGSGNLAGVYGYTVAGKSGTAKKILNGAYTKATYFSSFIGAAPAKKPRFVMIVSMDEPKPFLKHGIGYMYWGGKCAAPVFREIARRSLKYLGVAPDNPTHYPFGDPRRDVSQNYWEKESKELEKLNELWNSKP